MLGYSPGRFKYTYCSESILFHHFFPLYFHHFFPTYSFWTQSLTGNTLKTCYMGTYVKYTPRGRGALFILGDSSLGWRRPWATLPNLTCFQQWVTLETSRDPFQPESLYNPRGKEHYTVRCLGHSQGNDLWQERDMSKRKACVCHWNKAPSFSSTALTHQTVGTSTPSPLFWMWDLECWRTFLLLF